MAAANFRALWAILWFLLVYQLGIGRKLAAVLPRPPRRWSPAAVALISPPLIVWGLFCAGLAIFGGAQADSTANPGMETLFLSFPVRDDGGGGPADRDRPDDPVRPAPFFLPAGLMVAAALRADLDVQRQAVALADRRAGHGLRILHDAAQAALVAGPDRDGVLGCAGGGDRHRLEGQPDYERSFTGFANSSAISKSRRSSRASTSPTTRDDGGGHDLRDRRIRRLPADDGHGSRQVGLRLRRELHPRVFDVHPPDRLAEQAALRPRQWVNAWIAGSEMERDEDFTGPAIGILGATQLNGGAIGTLIVLACVALAAPHGLRVLPALCGRSLGSVLVVDHLLQRLVHGRQRRSARLVLLQLGFTTFPIVILMWWGSKLGGSGRGRAPS